MATNIYLNWALRKEPKKEHVSFKNFVLKFGFADKERAHKEYLLLLNSQHIRQERLTKLDNAYKIFKERSEDSFWAAWALKTADHRLLVTSATVAKETGALIQEAGCREAKAGLERYPSEMSKMSSLEVIDDSDDGEAEAEEVASPVMSMYSASSLWLFDLLLMLCNENHLPLGPI